MLASPGWGASGEGKRFFFEKKNQNTFATQETLPLRNNNPETMLWLG
jgi:hypothetical protein